MFSGPGFHNRKNPILSKIRSLLISLTHVDPSKDAYDRITKKIEYWIEYVLRERLMAVDELVEGVSYVAWEDGGSFANVGRFLKDFRDVPHCSEQARFDFVNRLCSYVLRWFAVASVEHHSNAKQWHGYIIASRGAMGFIRAASFVGHLIECGLLSHELVREHLVKPLTDHYCGNTEDIKGYSVRGNAIYQLFIAAGNTLFQGVFEAEDAWVCFETLEVQSKARNIMGYDAARVKELRKIHDDWLQQKDEEDQRNSTKTDGRQEEEEGVLNVEVPAEAETPVAFVAQDLPAVNIDAAIPSSILQGIELPSALDDIESSSETFFNVPAGTASPTLSISTVSDFTPTEFGEEIEHSKEQASARHDTFYFEDGNVEIVCGLTLFRVHSTVISFSSPKLRDILSPSALLNAPAPEGRPRITISESAEDFGVLLKMIYTPGFPAGHKVPEFTVFASLLRMTTKYGFSEVRDQLLENIKGAYPTKWKDFRTAKVLGEDIFGSPKPHPNAVLNLFEAQNVRFAIPFAAYRASIGGFSSIMSDKPGTVLPRRTLATTIHGMHTIRAVASHSARAIAYGGHLRLCPEKTCVINSTEKRMEGLKKIYDSLLDEREGGILTPPSLGHLLCLKCMKTIEATNAPWGSVCWEKLTQVFGISNGWDDLQ